MVTSIPRQAERFRGNDRVLIGIILGVITFWLFAQTTLNIAPDMGRDLGLGASTMNTAVALTALFSGIFIVVIGGLADRFGRVRIVRIGFYLSIAAPFCSASPLLAAGPRRF
jgi:MFS transporter, DHA2 family, multidrug resistance protein